MQYLREYQARNHKLPFSFDQVKIRNTYLRLKGAQRILNVTISDKTAEYLLFLLKSSQMWPEIIDFSTNYHKLTGNQEGTPNEIQRYYLSDALLQMPIEDANSRYYYQIIGEAVYPEQTNSKNNNHEITSGYITAMTKAYFKDGNPDKAFKFFKDNL